MLGQTLLAQVVLYGVSDDYKASQNCRMEAMYAHQMEVGNWLARISTTQNSIQCMVILSNCMI